MLATIIAVIVTLVIAIPVSSIVTTKRREKQEQETIGSAEKKARAIIDDALSKAEDAKREKLLEAQEENIKTRNDLEKEIRDRRAEAQRNEFGLVGVPFWCSSYGMQRS